MKLKLKLILVILFLILSFISGIYFCMTHKVPFIETMEQQGNKGIDGTGENEGCPDILIKSGNAILLYNSKLPESPTNPLPFYNLDEYINYLEIQRKKGIHCPVLFLQEENNAQGKNVFRIRPDIFNPQGGLPTQFTSTSTITPKPIQYVDSNDDNYPYNNGQHSGFDPTGLFIGKYTTLDAIHDSTHYGKSLSDNPMDENWGGVLHTKSAVDSGKYAENEVAPPLKNNMFTEKSDNIHQQKGNTKVFA
jgi:hypothetical protein